MVSQFQCILTKGEQFRETALELIVWLILFLSPVQVLHQHRRLFVELIRECTVSVNNRYDKISLDTLDIVLASQF